MGKYQFSMEKLLNLRENEEEEAKKEFLKDRARLIQEEINLEEIKKANKQLKYESSNHSDINHLRQQYVYSNYLEEQIEFQENRIDVISQEVEKKLSVLIGTQKDRMMMEKLKEKHKEVFQKNQNLKQQKELDEMGNLRFGFSII